MKRCVLVVWPDVGFGLTSGSPQVLAAAPTDGFAKVHYGFILKSENKIAESIPYLKVRGLQIAPAGVV